MITLPDLTVWGLPPLPLIQAKNFTPASREMIDIIVIHTMEAPEKGSTARNISMWFAGATAPQASAHYCIDDTEIIQCVLDRDVAWHAPGANHNGIGIEHAGYAKQTPEEWDDDFSQKMLAMSALLTATLCDKYDIPKARLSVDDLIAKKRGICGHKDITDAFNNGKGHWDPGPSFPWDDYITMVNGK